MMKVTHTQLEIEFTRDISTATFSKNNFTVLNDTNEVDISTVVGANNNLLLNINTPQVFYENFDDQIIVGDVSSADFSNNGVTGSGYSLDSSSVTSNWHQTTSDSLPSDVVAVSFWHYAVEESGIDYSTIVTI